MAKWATGEPPKKAGRYLVTYQTGAFGRQVRQADRVEYPKGHWYWSILPSGGYGGVSEKDVVAWQKCPEPYRG